MYKQEIESYQDTGVYVQYAMNTINSSQQLIIGVTNFLALAFCANDIINEDLDIGLFVTIQVYLIQIFAPLTFLGVIFNLLVTGFVDMYHFCKLMQEDNIIRDDPNAKELVITNPSIEFKNVFFKYSDSTKNAFNIQSNNIKKELVTNTIKDNQTIYDFSNKSEQKDCESSEKDAISTSEWILNDVSFSIPAGTSCALVGATGSGKSTCVRLL